MGGTIAICERESWFVQSLSAYLNLKQYLQYDTIAFDDAQRFLEYEEEHKSVFCLIGEGILDAFQTEHLLGMDMQLFYLSKVKKPGAVFKYQSVEKIAKDLTQLCMEYHLEDAVDTGMTNNRRLKIIGLYSPARHELQNALALTMGQLYATKHKTLYLNFEPYASHDLLMEKSFSHDLLDILFYVNDKETKLNVRLKAMTEKIGDLEFVPPAFIFSDLVEIEEKQWKRIITGIANETDYEILILDLTEQIKGLFSILSMCDEIYTFSSNTQFDQMKMSKYRELVKFLKYDVILEKSAICTLPEFPPLPKHAGLFLHSPLGEYVENLIWKGEEA